MSQSQSRISKKNRVKCLDFQTLKLITDPPLGTDVRTGTAPQLGTDIRTGTEANGT